MRKYNFGIIGLGKIARTFASSLKSLNLEIYGVASRDISKAKAFKDEYNAIKYYGSYQELFLDKLVEIVYIATPHGLHYELMIEALKYNKHIICEKAFTLNAKQAEEVFTLAKSKNLLVMEAMWSRFIPSWLYLKELVEQNKYGKITKLDINFAFKGNLDESNRLTNKTLGGGALLDIGVYNLNLAFLLLGTPNNIDANARLSATGIDLATYIYLSYKDAIANLYCSIDDNDNRLATIYFEKVTMIMPNFHCCEELLIYDKENNLINQINLPMIPDGFSYQIKSFLETLENEKIENAIMPPSISLVILKQIDDILSKLNIEY